MKAYIFDLDGTLFDSRDVWHQVDIDFLQKRGLALPSDYEDAISSMNFSEIAAYTIRRFSLPDSIEGLKQEWIDMAAYAYAHTVQMKPNAKKYLAALKERGAKLAVATTLSVELHTLALRKHGIYDLFDAVCTTDEAGCGKSRPDVFLLAAEKINAPPRDCLVFEDILAAVISAKSAGMKTCGVYDKASEAEWEQIKQAADYAIFDFGDAPTMISLDP